LIDTQRIAQFALLFIVFVLIGGPLLVLLRTGFLPDAAVPLASADVTLDQYKSVLSAHGTIGLLRNTFIYSAGSVLMGVLIATALAWMTERTDVPYRVTIRVLMFAWMTVPPLVIGFGSEQWRHERTCEVASWN
jgi:iron(III) transport system permease protein